jgi:hypothetical protein
MVEKKPNVVVAIVESIPAKIGVIVSKTTKAMRTELFEGWWDVRVITEGHEIIEVVNAENIIPLFELSESDSQSKLPLVDIIEEPQNKEMIMRTLLEQLGIASSKFKLLRKQADAIQIALSELKGMSTLAQ